MSQVMYISITYIENVRLVIVSYDSICLNMTNELCKNHMHAMTLGRGNRVKDMLGIAMWLAGQGEHWENIR